MSELVDIERRVLGNLPRFRTDEQHAAAEAEMREAGGHPAEWRAPRSIGLVDLMARLHKDPFTPVSLDPAAAGHFDEVEVMGVLTDMAARGLCESAGDHYAMTAAGLAALQS